jgi:hypothetical protein
MADMPEIARPPIVDATRDPAELAVLIDTAEKSAKRADESLKSIQDKASSLATLLVAVLPIAFAGTAFFIAQLGHEHGWLTVGAVTLFLVADLFLILGIVIAGVATGLAYTGYVNVARIAETGADDTRPARMRADIVDAWHVAMLTAAESSTRKAQDLFNARRAVAIALGLFLLAFTLIAIESGGNIAVRLPPPSS